VQGAGIKVRNGRREGIHVRGEKSSNTSVESNDRNTDEERKGRIQVRKGRSRNTGEEREGQKDKMDKEGAVIPGRKGIQVSRCSSRNTGRKGRGRNTCE
jgi:hypothetical protein